MAAGRTPAPWSRSSPEPRESPPRQHLRAYYRTRLGTFRQSRSRGGKAVTPPFGEVTEEVRQVYVHDRYQAMTAALARSARGRVKWAVVDTIPVAGVSS
ncbi:hypothetical protein [Streptomyces aurantiogriseus]|uniref:Uncharacterized protein n=1 Tax=Streptomyces aurantiogriseus TaxID=66870 RepID=A0A918KZQ2_9ACTN|nr:hypothetical protein [Streptomyces aurantiogriseus]GGR59380.1 hypothetical protein GCM10010251_90230 [Streptomyces aurantiogriseus]